MNGRFKMNPRSMPWLLPLLASGAVALSWTPLRAGHAASTAKELTEPRAPLYFETNRGQARTNFNFVARSHDCDVLIGPAEAVMLLRKADERSRSSGKLAALEPDRAVQTRSVVFRLEGANSRAAVSGRDELAAKANYYLGNDPAHWLPGVPVFGCVQIDQVYPGIRLLYHADDSARLEYDFIVNPGTRSERIGLQIEGVDKLDLDAAGDLVLKVGDQVIRQKPPVIYQVAQGARRRIEGGYRLKGQCGVGFWTGSYDPKLPLVIDPSLSFATYLGGNRSDRGWAVAVDGNGDVWVAGETLSGDLPTTAGAAEPKYRGPGGVFGDAFVAKFTAGTNLSYLTYLGGSGRDAAFGIAAGTNGDAFVTGFTDSPSFPLLNAIQHVLGGTNLNIRSRYPIDAFVTKLNGDGTLAYSTYLGGNSRDVGLGIAADNQDRAVVTGFTESRNFPTTNSVEGPYERDGKSYKGDVYHTAGDAFVARLSADGSALEYSSFLGGRNQEMGQGVAVDPADRAYVVGITGSGNFPLTNSFAESGMFLNSVSNLPFGTDGFISAISSNGGSLLYSSYLGGKHGDAAQAVAVDSSGNAYVTGYTSSTNFPVTSSAFPIWLSRTNLHSQVFVMKLDSNGSTNGGYSVVFGGPLGNQGLGIAVDPAGDAYVTGLTFSRTNFAGLASTAVLPLGFSATNSSAKKIQSDAFLVQLDPAGHPLFARYLGRVRDDQGNGIAFDPNANAAYIVGTSSSTNFPGTGPLTFHGHPRHTDAFVGRIQFP